MRNSGNPRNHRVKFTVFRTMCGIRHTLDYLNVLTFSGELYDYFFKLITLKLTADTCYIAVEIISSANSKIISLCGKNTPSKLRVLERKMNLI